MATDTEQHIAELLDTLQWFREQIERLGLAIPQWERNMTLGPPSSPLHRVKAAERQQIRAEMAVKWGEIADDILALGVPLQWGDIGSVVELAFAAPSGLNYDYLLIPAAMSRIITALNIAEGRLKRRLKQLSEPQPIARPAPPADGPTAPPPVARSRANRKVFLVHGHAVAVRESVARFLEKLDLKPIILQEEANRGQTLIEKLEAQRDLSFAVVLMTPDDVGAASPATGESPDLRPRARQNVMLELGYFIGVLGRENVCILTAGDIEMPSDYYGVAWLSIKTEGWQLGLARELKAARFDVDLNKAM